VKIGQGRSGTVYRSTNGNDIAIKVFSGEDSLTKLVNYLFVGAPNSYSWNKDAVECARLRRDILSVLVPYWFDSHVRIASSIDTGWNDEAKAYELETEFIQGRYAGLHHPFSKLRDWELSDLVNNVMKPLQKKLKKSGFDGLVWQAGKGTPTALNNFLLDDDGNWVWIDAESGVPALFPLNPIALVSYYLPRSIKFGRAMFDDVDTDKLSCYSFRNQKHISHKVGNKTFYSLVDKVVQLEYHQIRWKIIPRAAKSITYKLRKEKITSEQAEWYYDHTLLWYGRESVRLSGKALKKGYETAIKAAQKLWSIEYRKIIKNSFKFLFSGKYRKACIENYVNGRIQQWVDRDQLGPKEADLLREQVQHESTSPYLTDLFLVGLLKPVVKCIEVFGLPALYAMGVIDGTTLAATELLGGTIYRTLYTSGRMIYDGLNPNSKGNPRLMALFVGAIPSVGNAAYPVQMIYSASSTSKELAEFLTYDICSRTGEKIPIWGGRDTRTEHFFNHIPDVIVRNREGME
jgi:hypothetical protein